MDKFDPTTWSLEEWADDLCASHALAYRKNIRNPDFQLLPALMTFDRYGFPNILGMPFRNQHEKTLMFMLAQHELKRIGATRYAFYCEMWMATRAVADDLAGKAFVMPSADPNRVECVGTYLVERGREPVVRTQEIVRDARGRAVELRLRPEGGSNFAMLAGAPLRLLEP